MKNFTTILIILAINFSIFSQAPGTPDASFGINGTVISTIGNGLSWCNSIQIQNDEKIIAAGHSLNNGYTVNTLVRYNADGSMDNSFGTNGIVTFFVGQQSWINDIVLRNDGKILTAGVSKINDSTYNWTVSRYYTDGAPDLTFGNNGCAFVNVENSSLLYNMETQSNGKIVVTGYSTNGVQMGISCARFLSDGSLDSDFGNGGISIVKYPESPDVEAWAMKLDASDRIVTTGMFADLGMGRNKIAVNRFLSTGIPDSTFGLNGMVVTSLGNTDDFGNALAIVFSTIANSDNIFG